MKKTMEAMKKTIAIEKVKQMLTSCFTKCLEKYNQKFQAMKKTMEAMKKTMEAMKKTMAIEKVKQMLTSCFTKCSTKCKNKSTRERDVFYGMGWPTPSQTIPLGVSYDIPDNQCVKSTKKYNCTDSCSNCLVVFGLGCMVAFLLILVSLMLATFVMSIIYINDCELDPKLPICLIVEFNVHLLILIFLGLYVYTRKTSLKYDIFPRPSLLLCSMLVIFVLGLGILHLLVSLWMMGIKHRLNAPGRCNNTASASPYTVTSSWNLTTSPSYQKPVFMATNGSFLPNDTNQDPMNSTSPGTAYCPSCNKQFVDFIYPISFVRVFTVGMLMSMFGGNKGRSEIRID